MTRLLWLPDVLRAAGLTVHEVSGWRDRGGDSFSPRGVIIHETRGSINSTDAGEIRVLIEGSNTAPPPIAQLYLSRSGAWHVVASGRCNHVRTGQAGPFRGVGNTNLLGIEAQHAGSEPWTDTQYSSYVRGVAAILKHTGWAPPVGHKEHQPGEKTDPLFNMDTFRAHVARTMAGEDDMSAQAESILASLAAGLDYYHDNNGVKRVLVPTVETQRQIGFRDEYGPLIREIAREVGTSTPTMPDPAAVAEHLAANPEFVTAVGEAFATAFVGKLQR